MAMAGSQPGELSALIFGLDSVCGAKYNFRNVDLDELFRGLKESENVLRSTGAVNPRFYYCNIDLAHDVENLKRMIREGDPERGGKPWDTIGIGFGVRGNPSLTPFFEEMTNYSVEHGRGAKLTFTGRADEHLESLARWWPHMKAYLPAAEKKEQGIKGSSRVDGVMEAASN